MVGWFIETGQDLTILNKISKQISEANSSVSINFEDMSDHDLRVYSVKQWSKNQSKKLRKVNAPDFLKLSLNMCVFYHKECTCSYVCYAMYIGIFIVMWKYDVNNYYIFI